MESWNGTHLKRRTLYSEKPGNHWTCCTLCGGKPGTHRTRYSHCSGKPELIEHDVHIVAESLELIEHDVHIVPESLELIEHDVHIVAESLEPPERLRLIEEIFRTEENYLDNLKLVFEVSKQISHFIVKDTVSQDDCATPLAYTVMNYC